MALARKYQKIFGKNAQATDLSVVGSKSEDNPQYSVDVETIQSLSNWESGMRSIVTSSSAPYLEDHNSLFYVITSQLAYLFQAGIAEWNSQTEYVANRSVVLRNGKIYIAVANSTNVEPEVTANWNTYWKSLIDWGFLQGNIYNQTDLWNTLLKGIEYNSTVSSTTNGYPKGARLLYSDKNGNNIYVESLKDNNTDKPTEENIFFVTNQDYEILNVDAYAETRQNIPSASSFNDGDRILLLNNDNAYYNQILKKENGTWNTIGTVYSIAGNGSDPILVFSQKEEEYFVHTGSNTMVTPMPFLSASYSWIYRQPIVPQIVGVTNYWIKNHKTGTKDNVYLTTAPTLIEYGAVAGQWHSGWSFNLQVSNNGSNWTTISSWIVGDGDPGSSPIYTIILDKGVYWKFACSKGSYTLRYGTLYPISK